jgi:hypothetical protein
LRHFGHETEIKEKIGIRQIFCINAIIEAIKNEEGI